MKAVKFGLALFFVLFACAGLHAQELDNLRREAEKVQEEIRAINDLLSKKESEQKTSESQLKLIRNRIGNRRSIVSNLEKQSSVITNDITSKSGLIGSFEDSLRMLRKEYGDMVCNAYKNYKVNNFMLFLFASKDFNDATRRIAYMRRYNRMRQQKAEEIEHMSMLVTGEITELQGKKDDLVKVRQEHQGEINTLAKDEQKYKSTVSNLSKERSKLNSQAKAKLAEYNKLQKQIQTLVAAAARNDSKTPRTAAEDEYIAALSGRFDQNKGMLPYPVRGGVVIDSYGMHAHPTIKGIPVNNKGVNIAAGSGADVRAVFEGDVSQVVLITGYRSNVLIRHGNYYTVYSNLETVSVKRGDKVGLNQTIGRLASSDNDDEHFVHFEIWRAVAGGGDPVNLNPAEWIKR